MYSSVNEIIAYFYEMFFTCYVMLDRGLEMINQNLLTSVMIYISSNFKEDTPLYQVFFFRIVNIVIIYNNIAI